MENLKNSKSLSDLRLATACLLGFSGFLCASEVLNLRPCNCEVLSLQPCDCRVSAKMMKVQITSSKNNQLRQGDEARTGSRTCPVAQLEKFMMVTGMFWNDQRFIFWPIQKIKN